MRVFVTGAKGFVGSNLVRFLSEKGFKVLTDGGKEVPSDKVPEADAVFHNAAITKTFDVSKDEMLHSNVKYPQRLFSDLLAKGCRKFIVASSTAVYGNGLIPFNEKTAKCPYLNTYSESKILMESSCQLLLSKANVSYTFLRYCNIYGPGEEHKGNMASMIRQIILQLLDNKKPKLFEWGEQVRDYIHVEDVCRANLCALNSNYNGVVNCGSGFGISFEHLLAIISSVLGVFLPPEYVKNPHGEKYQRNTLCDMQLAKEAIGFEPNIKLIDGIRSYAELIKSQLPK